MIRRHLNDRPNLRTTGGSVETPWLFPGYRAGKHLDPQSIMQRLRQLGIDLLGARNAAIQNLVAESLPWSPNSSATATKSPTVTPKSSPSPGRGMRPSGRERAMPAEVVKMSVQHTPNTNFPVRNGSVLSVLGA